MAELDPIKNIVILMMENRSFDHMLGYLSLPPDSRAEVDGQSTDPKWLAQFTNYDEGRGIQPFLSTDPFKMPDEFDPPHERPNVAAQIDPRQDNSYPMNGFASAIPAKVSANPDVRKLVMGYFGAAQVPMNDFFAKNFTLCNRWFSSLPAGTQANRLMSMSGFSLIDVNTFPMPDQYLTYNWLNDHQISWRVYHQGIPFYAMMPKWVAPVLFDSHFREFKDLQADLINTPPDDIPQVIFIEPTYQDAPHVGRSTDEHAPSGVSDGQEFLMQAYNAVIADPDFWKGVVFIVGYDEHGGFFDHVRPPAIATAPPVGANYTVVFTTLGVRVPGYVISPFVKKGAVSQNLLDHTSVLRLLGEKFGNGHYSPEVDGRPVGSLSHLLGFTAPQNDPPAPPPLDAYFANRPPMPPGVTMPPGNTQMQKGFLNAVDLMKQHGADATHPKFGPLIAGIPNQVNQ